MADNNILWNSLPLYLTSSKSVVYCGCRGWLECFKLPTIASDPAGHKGTRMANLSMHHAHLAISRLENGRTHTGSLRFGAIGTSPSTSLGGVGRLSPEMAKRFLTADVVYVVYSYATPIMWVESDGDTFKCMQPLDKYSRTTTRHQTVARRGWWLRSGADIYAK